MLRLGKVAIPLTATARCVPDSVPPLGFAAITIQTAPVKPVATLPALSSSETRTGGDITPPARALLGACVNASPVAPADDGGGPAVMSNGSLVAAIKPGDVARSA